MPPRKSNMSTASVPTGEESPPAAASSKGKQKEEELSVDDLSMPRTMVQRLAKGVLPANTNIQKDALTGLSRSATGFIAYLSSEAQKHTDSSNRKTIQPADVLSALNDIEFPSFKPRLEAELAKYNDIQVAKRNEYRKKVRESTGTTGEKDEEEGLSTGQDATGKVKDWDREKSAKRARVVPGEALSGEEDEIDDEEGDIEETEGAEEEVEDEEEEGESAEGAEDEDDTLGTDRDGTGEGEEESDSD